MNTEANTATQPSLKHPCVADLLKAADRIQAKAKQAETLTIWKETLLRLAETKAEGGVPDIGDTLRDIQTNRMVGLDTDVGFFITCRAAEEWADASIHTDPVLNEIHRKMKDIERREGLQEDEQFFPFHPDTPEDYKRLNREWERRAEEVEASAMVAWLCRHGEEDLADMFLNNRPEWERRREAGGSKGLHTKICGAERANTDGVAVHARRELRPSGRAC